MSIDGLCALLSYTKDAADKLWLEVRIALQAGEERSDD